ncbi:ArsR/SmtB family transcription factor [Streptosporangium amethystogenes]|uniref:ArsR/SmtB family transcription factor n=1 Tax=Streptosporangium amethystogenes TaxID=2002 RepID=UPI003CCBAA5B
MVCGQFDVPVSMSTLSHHLKVLREAGLLRVTPEAASAATNSASPRWRPDFPASSPRSFGPPDLLIQGLSRRPTSVQSSRPPSITNRSANRFEAPHKTRYACLRSERP